MENIALLVTATFDDEIWYMAGDLCIKVKYAQPPRVLKRELWFTMEAE